MKFRALLTNEYHLEKDVQQLNDEINETVYNYIPNVKFNEPLIISKVKYKF